MADFVGAVDQGTTSTRFMIFDHGGNEIARHQLEHEQILPQAGWVEHNPAEIWERTRAVIQTALTKAKLRRVRPGRGRHHQPARDTRGVEQEDRQRPYYNAIVWQDTRTDRIASALDRDGRGDDDPPQGRVCRPRPTSPAARSSGSWRTSTAYGRRPRRRRDLRQHGQLAAVEPDRRHGRRRARHRPDQRQPHHADEPGDPGLGRRTARLLRRAARRCCPTIGPSSNPDLFGTTRQDGPFDGEVRADRRPRRPAGGDRRPGLLRARRGQEHLRHRQLPAAEHRRGAGPLAERPAHHRLLPVRRRTSRSTRWRARSR